MKVEFDPNKNSVHRDSLVIGEVYTLGGMSGKFWLVVRLDAGKRVVNLSTSTVSPISAEKWIHVPNAKVIVDE